MVRTLAIAGNTMREARRHKIYYSIVFFALVIILNAVVFTNLTVATQDRILRDVGTGAIDFFGVLLAIFLGVGMVSREVDRRTVYTVVTKPIRRSEFIVGKFLGLGGVLAVTLGVMAICLALVSLVTPQHDPLRLSNLAWHLGLRLVELGVVVAFAILVSTFTTSALAAFFTIGMYLIGHFSEDLHYFGAKSDSPFVRGLSKAIYYVLPNLDRFSVSEEIAYNKAVEAGPALVAAGYGALYIAAFLIAAVVVFERRDFK